MQGASHEDINAGCLYSHRKWNIEKAAARFPGIREILEVIVTFACNFQNKISAIRSSAKQEQNSFSCLTFLLCIAFGKNKAVATSVVLQGWNQKVIHTHDSQMSLIFLHGKLQILSRTDGMYRWNG